MAKVRKIDQNDKKPKLPVKKQQTVRERTQVSDSRPKRIRQSASRIKTPLSKARVFGKKEYNLPLPTNKAGKVLGKRVRIFPKFIREAWAELRLVKWPSRKETLSLTMAVFIFAVVFAAIVGALDFALDKLFREVILK